jgi:hypothetical protein
MIVEKNHSTMLGLSKRKEMENTYSTHEEATRNEKRTRAAPSLTGFKKGGALSYGTVHNDTGTATMRNVCINPFFPPWSLRETTRRALRFPTRVDRMGCDAIAVGHTSGHRHHGLHTHTHTHTHTRKMIGFPSHSSTFIYDSLGLYF